MHLRDADAGEAAAVARFRDALTAFRDQLQSILRDTPGKDERTWHVVKLILRAFEEAKRLDLLLSQHYRPH